MLVAPPPFQTLVRPLLAFPTGPLFPLFSSVFPGTVPPVTRAPSYILAPSAVPVGLLSEYRRPPAFSHHKNRSNSPNSSPSAFASRCEIIRAPLKVHTVAHSRPLPRFHVPLLRDQPAARPRRPRFVDKLHSPPQTKYGLVFLHLCPSGGTGRRASFRS